MAGDHGGQIESMIVFHLGVQEWGEVVAANNEHISTTNDPLTMKAVDIGITTCGVDIHAKHIINTINQRANQPILKLQAA